MSFEKMKVNELRGVADSFGVDLEGAKNKASIIATLVEEGITYDLYVQFSGAEKETDDTPVGFAEEKADTKRKAKAPVEDLVLVKMERKNPHYETQGYTFTREHPYVAMTAEDAQKVFDAEEWGFRMANPREVQEYYS